DKPPRVYIQNYELAYSSQVGRYTWLRFVPVTESITMAWTKDCAGANSAYHWLLGLGYPTNVAAGSEAVTWPADTYPPTLPGDETSGTNDLGQAPPPPLTMERCNISGTGYFYNLGDSKIES